MPIVVFPVHLTACGTALGRQMGIAQAIETCSETPAGREESVGGRGVVGFRNQCVVNQ